MKTEFTKLTEFGIPEMNSENLVNSVFNSAPLRLCGEKSPGRWLPDMDLNHDKQIQSLLCYRYTIGQTDVSQRLGNFAGQSSRQAKLGGFGQPRRGNIFVATDFRSNPSSVRSEICRPAGARAFSFRFNYKDFAPNGATN